MTPRLLLPGLFSCWPLLLVTLIWKCGGGGHHYNIFVSCFSSRSETTSARAGWHSRHRRHSQDVVVLTAAAAPTNTKKQQRWHTTTKLYCSHPNSNTVQTTLSYNSNLLQGCVCLVTGASRGIGKGIALELGRCGATVYVTGTTTTTTTTKGHHEPHHPGTIEETSQQVTAAGGQGIAVYCDHSNDQQVQALFHRIDREQDGRLDILINNAFRLPPHAVQDMGLKFWQHMDDSNIIAAWDSVHQVGLRNHFVTTVHAMPLLLKTAKEKYQHSHLPRPFIGMISSFGGLTYTFNVPYGVGKAGVDRMVKDMAVELETEDICVTSFWPGVVKTERTEILVQNGQWDKHVKVPLIHTESPQFTGRAIVAVATDPENRRCKSGTFQVVAELAQEYGFTDVDGTVPPSIRSLRFLLPSYAMDETTRNKIPSWLIPDWKLPFWLMAQGRPPA